jgi:hypothetical protein
MRRFVSILLLVVTTALTAASQSNCPSFTIVGPSTMIFPEEEAEFRVKFSSENIPEKISYTWGSTAGDFVPSVEPVGRLRTTYEEGGLNITVFAKMDGLPANCPNITSAVFPTASRLEGDPLDQFRSITRLDLMARIDNLFASILHNPGYNGLIEIHFGINENRMKKLQRLQDLSAALQFRKFDLSRLEILILERPSEARTVLWIGRSNVVPRDLRNERYTIYKAASLIQNPQKAIDATLCRCK